VYNLIVKRSEAIKKLKAQGWTLHRRGSRHDLYVHRLSGRYAEVPRHAEELSNWVMNDLKSKMREVERRMEEQQ
jgi:predicted RNA binding protein YcfA (HicA-like mRNA interferase family)